MARGVALGDVIRKAREKAGMTQQALAYLAGTSQDAIWAIEKGERTPGWDTAARIIAVLQVSASEIGGAIKYEADAVRDRWPKR